MKRLLKLFIILGLVFAGLQFSFAQDSKADKKAQKKAAKEAEIKALIENKNFIFNARFMYPLGGGQKYLEPYYDLEIGKDTVTSFLPYYGVVRSGGGYSPDDNGVKFTSTRFEYVTEANTKGGWSVTIKPKDVRSANQMVLTIASNGNADLSVISNTRDRIRYDGYISQKQKAK